MLIIDCGPTDEPRPPGVDVIPGSTRSRREQRSGEDYRNTHTHKLRPGKMGCFALHHRGVMSKGELTIAVAPGSGKRELNGLVGEVAIIVAGAKHSYAPGTCARSTSCEFC